MIQVANHLVRDVSDSVGLLISILVRYPEVATINYDPKANSMKFTFIVKEAEISKSLSEFTQDIKEYLLVYHGLEQTKVRTLDFTTQSMEGFSIIEILRDVQSMSQEEIALIVSMTNEHFGTALVTESNDSMMEDELEVQEELIGHMLDSLRFTKQEKNLIAFREEGKVLVFNK